MAALLHGCYLSAIQTLSFTHVHITFGATRVITGSEWIHFQHGSGEGNIILLNKSLFDLSKLKLVLVLGFSMQIECTKLLTSRNFSDRMSLIGTNMVIK